MIDPRPSKPAQHCLPTSIGWAHVRPHRLCPKATFDGQIVAVAAALPAAEASVCGAPEPTGPGTAAP